MISAVVLWNVWRKFFLAGVLSVLHGMFCASTNDHQIMGYYSRIFIFQCVDGEVQLAQKKTVQKSKSLRKELVKECPRMERSERIPTLPWAVPQEAHRRLKFL